MADILKNNGSYAKRMMPCTVHLSSYTSIHRKIITVITTHLIFNLLHKIQFNINFAQDIYIDVAYNVLPVYWMQVYPKRFDPFYIEIVLDKIKQL